MICWFCAARQPKSHETMLFAIFAPCWHGTKNIKKLQFFCQKIDILGVSVRILASWNATMPIPRCQEAKMPAFSVPAAQLPGFQVPEASNFSFYPQQVGGSAPHINKKINQFLKSKHNTLSKQYLET